MLLGRKKQTSIQAEYRQRRVFSRPQTVPSDLFKRDKEHHDPGLKTAGQQQQVIGGDIGGDGRTVLGASSSAGGASRDPSATLSSTGSSDATSSHSTVPAASTTTVSAAASPDLGQVSALGAFVTKSTDKKLDKYERFLRKIENRAVKTDILVEQLGIDHVSIRKKVTTRTSLFFRSQVEKPVYVKPTPTEEFVYHYAVAAVLQPLEPSSNAAVLETSRKRWYDWLHGNDGQQQQQQQQESVARAKTLILSTPPSSRHAKAPSPASVHTDASPSKDGGPFLETPRRRNSIESHHQPATTATNLMGKSNSELVLDDLRFQSQSSSMVLMPDMSRSTSLEMIALNDVETETADATPQRPPQPVMTKTRSQLIFDDVQLNEEELADILAHSIPQSPAIWTNPAFGPGTTQNLFESPGFSARKMAHDMAEIGIVAGNLKTSLTKSYKEWELLTTLQRLFQLDPELNKRIIASERKRSSNEELLLFDFSLRIAALSAHPIYTADSFSSHNGQVMWMQRELIEVAHRTSNLSSKDQASLANTRKALLARRESSFVGKIHIEVLGVGQAANHEWASSFGFQQDVAASDYPWNDVENVLNVTNPASQIKLDLVSCDGISDLFLETVTVPEGSQFVPPPHDVTGSISLPMDLLAQEREGVIITELPLEQRWSPLTQPTVVVQIVFKWHKDNYYALTDHYSIYQYLSRKAMETDIKNGNTGAPFPTTSVAELLERYGQRHGVRQTFRLISDFEILAEKFVDTGELELTVVLNAADRLVKVLSNEVTVLNTVERNFLSRSIEQLRGHLVNRLEKYRECFPSTQPLTACKNAISLLRQVVLLQQILDGNAHTGQDFQEQLRECVKANGLYMLRMMEGLTEGPRTFHHPDAIKQMAEFILPELIADERFYMDAFPIPVLSIASTVLFQGLTQVTEAFLPDYEFMYTHSISWFRGFHVLKRINERFGPHVDRSIVEPFPLDKWYKPSVNKWLAMLNTHVHDFVQGGSMNKWASTAVNRLHNDNVLELLYWLEGVLDFLHQFSWAKPETASDLLMRFGETVSGEIGLLGRRILDFALKHKTVETPEKSSSWRPTWGRGATAAKDLERKLTTGMVDRKLCVLLNNIGLCQRWVEKLQGATMALLELHLKKTDPELRTNYMASDYPIEHLFHDCGLGLSDILDKLMQRTIKPLRELLTMDAAALVDRVQKLRMSMRAEPSPSSSSSSSSSATSMAGLLPASSLSGSSLNSASTSGLPFRTTDIVDVETELGKAVDPLVTRSGAFVEASAAVLYDRVFSTIQLRVFEAVMQEVLSIVHMDSFRVSVQQDPLLATYIIRCVDLLKSFFGEGENALSSLHMDTASNELMVYLKTGIIPSLFSPAKPSSKIANPSSSST